MAKVWIARKKPRSRKEKALTKFPSPPAAIVAGGPQIPATFFLYSVLKATVVQEIP